MQRRQSRKSSPSLRARALRLLARREHSRLELQRKLAPHAQDPDELAGLLDDLRRRGWLSESRVVEQIIHARREKFGSRRIRQELLEKGVAEELVAASLPGLEDGDAEAARAVWQKKFGKLPRSPSERARQARFLQNRGFSHETIRQMLRELDD